MRSFNDLKIFVENLIESTIKKRRSNRWKKKAKKFLGKEKALAASQKKDVLAYYKDYGKPDMVFHEFYTQKTGKFFANYIPSNFHYCKIDPFFNDWSAAHYLDNKCFYDDWYFRGINMPKTLAKRVNGMWMIPTENELCFVSEEEAYKLISRQDCFVKQATLSSGGFGVHKVKEGTPIDEIKKIVALLAKDIIVQEPIQQSKEMCKLNPTSVNTVRMMSFLSKDGNVKIYSAVVRMGINNAVVDNASSGGITCGVESDGRLKPVA